MMFWGCEHVAGKAKEDFGGTVAPVLVAKRAEHSDVVFREGLDVCRNVSAAKLALDNENGRVDSPLLAVMHAHRGRVYSE